MNQDVSSLYEFLLHTPEQGLRKSLVDGKTFTDAHLALTLKIVRACNVEEFGQHYEKQDYPKIKFGPAESKIREKYWLDAIKHFQSRGLISNTKAA